jgi:hypothetical protein
MKSSSIYAFLLLCFIALPLSEAMAQDALKPRPSPLEMVTMKWEDTYLKITYSRPHKRGRVIFGELVPYGKVWRLGANEATELTTTGTIKLAGNEVPAGTYSLFAIPEKDEWTIILNKDLGQWGAYRYDEEKDFLRFTVPVTTIETAYEPFTMEFEQSGNDVSLKIMWDQTSVIIPVEFE